MAVTETANKALAALVSKGIITAAAAVGECEISVEKPVPPPRCFASESKRDPELPTAAQRRKMTQASHTLLWVTSNCRQPRNIPHFLNLCLGKQQQLELVAGVFEVFRHHNSGCHRCTQAQKMFHREPPL